MDCYNNDIHELDHNFMRYDHCDLHRYLRYKPYFFTFMHAVYFFIPCFPPFSHPFFITSTHPFILPPSLSIHPCILPSFIHSFQSIDASIPQSFLPFLHPSILHSLFPFIYPSIYSSLPPLISPFLLSA